MQSVQQSNITTTTNGARAFKSTGVSNLDFFSKSGNINYPNLIEDFNKAIREDEELGLRNLLHMRDVRGGKGVRNNTRILLDWLSVNHPDFVTKSNLLQQIIEVGRWDDIFALVKHNNPLITSLIVKTVASELLKEEPNALMLKWLPINSKQEFDRKFLYLLRNYLKLDAKTLRKSVTSRRKVFIPEFKFCTKQWSLLDYSKLPSQCFRKNRKSFERNDTERFNEFTTQVIKGEVSVNAGTLYPHEVMDSLRSISSAQEALWKNLPNFLSEGLKILPVVDVSLSMQATAYSKYTCMDIAVSLGIYLAERNTSVFKDRFLTFETQPHFVSLEGLTTLKDRVVKTLGSPWGGSTNLEGVFTSLLNEAKVCKVSQQDMPEYILIVSDGQFNAQVRGDNQTSINLIKSQYAEAGYKPPIIVFWNVSSNQANTPAEYREDGVVLLSGYSPSILKSIFNNSLDQYTPLNAMLSTLLNERYNLTFKD